MNLRRRNQVHSSLLKSGHRIQLGAPVTRRVYPVSFRWKGSEQPDLGLLAGEVEWVEPLLVTCNERGEIEGVKYDRTTQRRPGTTGANQSPAGTV